MPRRATTCPTRGPMALRKRQKQRKESGVHRWDRHPPLLHSRESFRQASKRVPGHGRGGRFGIFAQHSFEFQLGAFAISLRRQNLGSRSCGGGFSELNAAARWACSCAWNIRAAACMRWPQQMRTLEAPMICRALSRRLHSCRSWLSCT